LFKQYHSKQQELEQTEKEKLGAELNYLKSQINPHYLFNTLNTIYSYALDNSRNVPEMLLKLSNNLRYVLYDSESPRVCLAKEIQHLENYIALQQLRLEGRVVVNFSVVGPVEKNTIAPLLLIAFVENAFKHGSEPIQTTSEINVRITIQEGVLHFTCENQYLETQAAASAYKHTEGGIGLHNAAKRLKLMYGQNFTLNTSREDGHFVAQLKITL
jgi:sensor histidine kinase YesM